MVAFLSTEANNNSSHEGIDHGTSESNAARADEGELAESSCPGSKGGYRISRGDADYRKLEAVGVPAVYSWSIESSCCL